MFLRELFERRPLLEATTKGSQQVLTNPKLVAQLAAQFRDDDSVPPDMFRKAQKMDDKAIAEYICTELDRMEAHGFGGVVYGRNGQFNNWACLNYANGRDIWEDMTSVLPEALRDYSVLKNRNLLAQRHIDIQQFKGAKALKRYLVVHYAQQLKDVIEDAKMAYLIKSKRSVKLADTPEYGLYLLQNRGAACAFGKGATFCTANSEYEGNYVHYSNRAALIGLAPKEPEDKSTSRGQFKEKYQFDAGSANDPRSASFKDVLDQNANSADIKKKYPYLWDDLVKGMNAHRAEIETPTEEQGIIKKPYEVDAELAKLKTNLAAYWTDKKRPAVAPTEPASVPGAAPTGEAPAAPVPPAPQV
jgi:hypothetical protein